MGCQLHGQAPKVQHQQNSERKTVGLFSGLTLTSINQQHLIYLMYKSSFFALKLSLMNKICQSTK